MALLAELVVGILEIVTQFLLEIVGYLIWGILEMVLTAAGGFFGGLLIGIAISIALFCFLASAWAAFWWSCLAMVLSIGFGVLVEAGGGVK